GGLEQFHLVGDGAIVGFLSDAVLVDDTAHLRLLGNKHIWPRMARESVPASFVGKSMPENTTAPATLVAQRGPDAADRRAT
ncbi:MAG: hypothetical protein K8F36_01010, partial [Melioribacteraceae bacterium]|nr:hypothetical protein [Melioribacteraceae bacterium]